VGPFATSTQEFQMVEIGQVVTYVDPKRVEHDALVTQVWGPTSDPANPPGINLVIVSKDDTKGDPYGRQIQRETSVVHERSNPAPGNFWRERAA
jgi:hypothetical protein